MNIQIEVRRMSVTRKIRKLVHELCAEIHKKYKAIHNFNVVIEDINGPHKAGVDKRCHISARGRQRLAVDIDQVDEDLLHVILHAFSRLSRALQRSVRSRFYKLHNSEAIDAARLMHAQAGDYE